jgi:adenylate cyclase
MAQEIERKFLVANDAWRDHTDGKLYRQGYIPTTDARTVRIRIVGDQGLITLKGPVVNMSRSEFEYAIPLADAEEMLSTLCDPPLIEKYRYQLPVDDLLWEIDEFLGDNQGLLIAEVELVSPDQAVSLPHWVGKEVTGDERYYNSYLARHPFCHWSASRELGSSEE